MKRAGKLVSAEVEPPLDVSGELEAAQRNELFRRNKGFCLCMCHAPRCLIECRLKSNSQISDLAWAACPPIQAGFCLVTNLCEHRVS